MQNRTVKSGAPGRDYAAAANYVSNVIADLQNTGMSQNLSDRFKSDPSALKESASLPFSDRNCNQDRHIIDVSVHENNVARFSTSEKSGSHGTPSGQWTTPYHSDSRHIPNKENLSLGGVAIDPQGPNKAPSEKPPFDLSALQLQVHSGVGDYLWSIGQKVLLSDFEKIVY